jgi:hypothetical protein
MNQANNSQLRSPTQPISRFNNRYVNTNSTPKGYTGSKVFGIILVVVIVILLIGACYWLYQFYRNRTFQTINEVEVMPDVKDGAAKFNIGTGSIPSSNYSNEYNVSMWINIDNYTYNYGKEKTILRRGDKGSGNPEIILGDKNNDLIVRLKLQVPTAGSTSSSVSKFADIPLSISNVNSNSGNSGNSGNSINMALNKVGNNVVDYPTIQYENAMGCDNALTSLQPESSMTIMPQQKNRMKEGFQEVYTKIADNSAPLESQKYSNEYFSAISGNEIPQSADSLMIKEGFDAVADISNATANVLLDICNISKAMQSQTNADADVNATNKMFQSLIDALETSRGSAKTTNDITTSLINTTDSLNVNFTGGEALKSLIEKLLTDLATLSSVSNNSSSSITLEAIQNNVNAKLTTANCPLTLSGASDISIITNFYESLIQLVKKSLYTYINNLGHGIKKAYPELAGQQSANCLIDQSMNKDPSIGTCIYRALPLQRWVHIVVSVYNQVVDIFVDGKLASSCVLPAFPALSTSDVQITPDGGFAGKISRVKFSNTAMTIQHARKLYYDGPVPSTGILSMIPNWVWYVIIFLIIIGIGYSVMM